jgi:uncharacterized protein
VIVLDTTVLVYAKGGDHRLRDPCRELIAAISECGLVASTTIEVIQEFVHVRARRRGRADAAALGRDYADLLSPLLTLTAAHLRQGLLLIERTERLGAFDAVLGAATASAGASALVSAETAFGQLPDVRHVFPDSSGVAALLSSGGDPAASD